MGILVFSFSIKKELLLLFVLLSENRLAQQAGCRFVANKECGVFQMAGYGAMLIYIGIEQFLLLVGHRCFQSMGLNHLYRFAVILFPSTFSSLFIV